jgi:hypothetical protein
MSPAGPKRRRRLAVTGVVTAVLVYGLFVHTPPGPRSLREFDADQVARLETEMWQAYYDKRNVRLFVLLTELLRAQRRYPWAKAGTEAFYLARPAARFARMTGGYDVVLPDLEHAYAMAKDWTGATYDPSAVARAELAWWIARRDPAARSPENVGRLIAVLYAQMYAVPVERVATAGRLRAEAAALRDRDARQPDWATISTLLQRSYRELHAAVH